MRFSGNLEKLDLKLEENVLAWLPVGDQKVFLNELIGETISLKFTGGLNCVHCGRKISKTYGQGYCYPCISSLAECDSCLYMPEKCHYAKGTCREPEWGEQNCFKDHIVYLSNTSSLKVGITKMVNVPSRWLDQGATQALPIVRVSNRLLSGEIEVMLKSYVSDKTNWRAMLKSEPTEFNLEQERDRLLIHVENIKQKLQQKHGPEETIELLSSSESISIKYPVAVYPEKVSSLSFDKTPDINSKLLGIKGQYLFLEQGVLNIRKFSGYNIEFKTHC